MEDTNEVLRIQPRRIIAWNLDGQGHYTGTVARGIGT